MANERPTVLIVEDDENIQELLTFLLEREEVAVVIAPDGLKGQEMIETLDPPSLVLLDVMLPYQDGYQLLAKIRERSGWESVPVLMLTTKSMESDIVRGLEGGANDYVIKPFQPLVLLARIKRYLEG